MYSIECNVPIHDNSEHSSLNPRYLTDNLFNQRTLTVQTYLDRFDAVRLNERLIVLYASYNS